ncbi:MAG: hypothetical protein JWO38_4730 [Gemmataceae bacterium]|nr:hypothetical protein [Gemmataceae bacterium]
MDEMPTDGFRHRPLWLLGVAGLVLAQAGLALSLFGPARSPAGLLDARPVLSGRHPLHLYHGALGAHTFCHRGATTCYDPGFQAGYPKTPVFDGGCRPAELFLAIGGGGYSPAAYKVGLFACLVLIPLAFVLAARGAGLPAGAAVLAGACGTVLGWTWPVRRLIEEGEIDFLAAGLGVIVSTAWLGRYARWFGVDSWLILAAVATAGWYAHPVVWVGLTPVVVAYYLVLAPRKELAWHLGLVGITAAGLVPNLWWLTDWGRYWWLRLPSPADHVPPPAWDAVLGTPGDYVTLAGYVPFGGLLVLTGAAGLVALWRGGYRESAVLLLSSTLLTVTVARVLAAWPRVPPDAPERLAPLAAGFLALPAAFGLWKVLERGRFAAVTAAGAVTALLVVGWADGPDRPLAGAARLRTDPLVIGLSADQEQVVVALRDHTTPDARVLWDETTDHRPGWNWTALLPVLTGRAYLGGLDHDAGMEYSFCGMWEGRLNGRGLGEWTDPELGKFCEWYNVGWVVCRSPAAADRWGRLPMAKPVARLKEGGQPVVVYALDRPRSFVLAGSARWESATPNRITLTDVIPDADGKVTLSLHYLEGLRVYPSYVKLDPAKDGQDPITHVRLRPYGPVPRVTLVWENP